MTNNEPLDDDVWREKMAANEAAYVAERRAQRMSYKSRHAAWNDAFDCMSGEQDLPYSVGQRLAKALGDAEADLAEAQAEVRRLRFALIGSENE